MRKKSKINSKTNPEGNSVKLILKFVTFNEIAGESYLQNLGDIKRKIQVETRFEITDTVVEIKYSKD